MRERRNRRLLSASGLSWGGGGVEGGEECQKSFEFQAKTAVYLVRTLPLCLARNTMYKTKASGFWLQPQYFLSCCHFHLGAWAVPRPAQSLTLVFRVEGGRRGLTVHSPWSLLPVESLKGTFRAPGGGAREAGLCGGEPRLLQESPGPARCSVPHAVRSC